MPTAMNSDSRKSPEHASAFADPAALYEVLDEVFAEMPTREELVTSVPPLAVTQSMPAAPRPTEVAYQPQPQTRVTADDDFDWSYYVKQAICGGLVLLGVVLFYCGMPAAWQAAINPLADSPVANTTPASQSASETKPIEDVRVGDRIIGRNPIRNQAEIVEPDTATWRKISLHLTKESGLGLEIDLLRQLAWIEEHNAIPGGTIFIDLDEMGAVGDAAVIDIGPCPQIQPGAGAVVTGTFKHQADEQTKVVHLRLEDQLELTGVTANHPYWSEDRQDFVEVGNLRAGELVDTAYGLKHVVSVTPIAHNGFLHNLETTEHVYRVGALGTLVHNFCVHRISSDAQGRVRSAIAHITPADLGTGTATNSATRAAARALGNSTDDAGHLIGRLLGGPGGKTARNFFAQNPHINRGQFAQLEQRVAELVRNGDDVWIRVTPQYAGNGTRAIGVLYQVRVNGQATISQLLGN